MAVYLVSAVVVTTLLVPRAELLPGGAAEHRALAYLAHGSPLGRRIARHGPEPALRRPLRRPLRSVERVHSLPGRRERDDGPAKPAAALPEPTRHGSELGRQGRRHHASCSTRSSCWSRWCFGPVPSSQQWAYATSVLVLLAGAALAAAKDLRRSRRSAAPNASLLVVLAAGAGGFFLAMTGLTVLINHSGLTIAMAFVAGDSRQLVRLALDSQHGAAIRGLRLCRRRDAAAMERTLPLGRQGARASSARPDFTGRTKRQCLQRDYRLDPATPVIFIEAALGDPSNFYQKPLMKIEREGELEVIRVSRCVSISHVLAAICLELCRDGGMPAGNHLRLVARTAAGRQSELPAARRRQHSLDGQRTGPQSNARPGPTTSHPHRVISPRA